MALASFTVRQIVMGLDALKELNGLSYSKNIANFEVFFWNISSSINLKSDFPPSNFELF